MCQKKHILIFNVNSITYNLFTVDSSAALNLILEGFRNNVSQNFKTKELVKFTGFEISNCFFLKFLSEEKIHGCSNKQGCNEHNPDCLQAITQF
jgi:hypothetical protein